MDNNLPFDAGVDLAAIQADQVTVNLLDLAYRKKILAEIAAPENMERKAQSFKQFEVYHERAFPYVLEYLNSQFSKETVESMPIVDCIHISKRIVQKQATLYSEPPKREITELTDEQKAAVLKFYSEKGIDCKLSQSNSYFKLQDQSIIWATIGNEGLKLRTLLPHMVDIINGEDEEDAEAYIVNTFDRSFYVPDQNLNSIDGANQTIADADDYRKDMEKRKFLVWTKTVNFIFNGLGEIVGTIKPNQIKMLPFVDVANSKDLEFWVRGGRALTDFSVQFNGVMSDLYNVVKMQGWAVGYMKGPSTLIPEKLTVGPNMILKLAIDPNNPVETDFGYASPNADIGGSIQFLETLTAMFLSSKGVDAKAISSKLEAQQFSSGVERLLAMLDVFESSKDDMKSYAKAEMKLFKIISAWSNLLIGDPKKKIFDFLIPETVSLTVSYCKPELVNSKSEQLDVIKKRLDMKLMTKVEAIQEDRGVDSTRAEEIKEEIEAAEMEDAKKRAEILKETMPDEMPMDEKDQRNMMAGKNENESETY